MELCSMLCASLDRRGLGRKTDTCIWMAESHHCSPKTITTLLTGIPQYKMFLVLKNKIKNKILKINKQRKKENPFILTAFFLSKNIQMGTITYDTNQEIWTLSSALLCHCTYT